ALATGFDDDAGRYVGLWTPQDKSAAPVATDSLLLVRPDVAIKQKEAETSVPSEDPDSDPSVTDPSVPTVPKIDVVFPTAKTRFYGVKTLSADKIALDFKNIAEEVIAHLRADMNTSLTVRIEIEATDSVGFDEGKVRTVA